MKNESFHPTELLAIHLAPRFGDLYEYNLGENGLAGYDLQEWTDALKAAVRRYLVEDVPADVFAGLSNNQVHLPGAKEAQVDELIEGHEPWELGLAVREAAVAAVPTLKQLIGHLSAWQDADQQEDAAVWIDAHASAEQLAGLARVINHPQREPDMPWYKPEPEGRHFAWKLTPPELLKAWHHVRGSSASLKAGSQLKSRSAAAPAAVRAWARANGYNVGERGRVPIELIRRYEQARSPA